jgi:hypothetical protein
MNDETNPLFFPESIPTALPELGAAGRFPGLLADDEYPGRCTGLRADSTFRCILDTGHAGEHRNAVEETWTTADVLPPPDWALREAATDA